MCIYLYIYTIDHQQINNTQQTHKTKELERHLDQRRRPGLRSLYYIMLYYITLYYTMLYYTIL